MISTTYDAPFSFIRVFPFPIHVGSRPRSSSLSSYSDDEHSALIGGRGGTRGAGGTGEQIDGPDETEARVRTCSRREVLVKIVEREGLVVMESKNAVRVVTEVQVALETKLEDKEGGVGKGDVVVEVAEEAVVVVVVVTARAPTGKLGNQRLM